ncbi:kinase-like domain-containing protein [Amylostereum chailletii]|nr:kinase-like domain-containing protein [Amylostereum chailletii]
MVTVHITSLTLAKTRPYKQIRRKSSLVGRRCVSPPRQNINKFTSVPCNGVVPSRSKSARIIRALSASAPALDRIPTVNDFHFLATLRDDSHSKVHLVKGKKSGCMYALKAFTKSWLSPLEGESVMLDSMLNEMRIHRDARAASFILDLKAAFHDTARLFILTDYYHASLYDIYASYKGHFPQKLLRFYTAEIACAINQLHSLGIVHRDIKPTNIFINADGHIRVSEFGLACRLEVNPAMRSAGRTPPTAAGIVGTLGFLAPEVLRGTPYTYPVDYFSLGVVVHTLAFNKHPWEGTDQESLIEEMYCKSSWALQTPGLDPSLGSLLSGLLDCEPHTRFALHEIMHHAFCKDL